MGDDEGEELGVGHRLDVEPKRFDRAGRRAVSPSLAAGRCDVQERPVRAPRAG